MFNSLTGIVTGKFPQKLFIAVGGIEWDICVPESSLEKFPHLGEEAKVFTWLQHTDSLMTLFGFASENDRSLFFDLLRVDGIGPKGALKILSSTSSNDLVNLLNQGDVEALQKVPGVGKKTAAKILLQLKGKLSLEDNISTNTVNSFTSPYAAVITALVNMGYEKRLIEQSVSKIVEEQQKDSLFANKTVTEKEDAIFRLAIMELAQ